MSSDNYYCGVCGEELTERDSNGMLYCGKCIPNNITQSTDTPSDTPRTDAIAARIANPDDGFDSIGFCKQLERELAAARSDLECQGQAYSKALDDLAAANKRLEEVTNIVARFAAWSKKWPKDVIHRAGKEREMHDELDAIEAAALAAIDGKEGK